ncbi:ABC-2 type transport system permease protein [Clostridium cavendishii DSM 21758]|uniref:ABC-2 type transport system permease protein n=1 Tax=Clostridium cavendishii DSM 21758 TaxID=1121302 RepID=A0A1M6EXV0_9CLOT|nr:ABC-2 family transporter protein [Clostridium cavendishii]SHI90219.1 ABC-2 type transport system permease protein [Clostridium cavendishii DSM 21758]
MKLYLKYFSIHLKSAMQYKTSFFLNSLGQALTSLFSFICMYFLFDRFNNIKGYTFNEVLLCFSTILMAFSLAECFGRGFDNFSSIISNGEFDRIMVRPRSEILQVIGARIEFSRVGRLIQAIIVLIYAVISCEVKWTFLRIVTLIFMILGGMGLFFGLFMIYGALSFFTIEGLEFMNIFTDGGRELAQYPLDIYKKWILNFFTYIVPLALVNYYPLMYILGRVDETAYLYMLSPLAIILFLIICNFIWKIGVAHYKSTGS